MEGVGRWVWVDGWVGDWVDGGRRVGGVIWWMGWVMVERNGRGVMDGGIYGWMGRGWVDGCSGWMDGKKVYQWEDGNS